MSENNANKNGSNSGSVVPGLLLLGAGLIPLAGLIAGCYFMLPLEASWDAFAVGLGIIVGSLSAGAVLIGIWYAVKLLQETLIAQRKTARILLDIPLSAVQASHNQAPGNQSASAGQEELLAKISHQLAELNSNSLLTEQQKQARRKGKLQTLQVELISQTRTLIESGEMEQSRQALAELELELPDDLQVAQLRELYNANFSTAESDHIQKQTKHAQDLMSVARYDQAIELAKDLAKTYPNSDDAKKLLEKVTHEAKSYATQQRMRFVELIHEHGQAREWVKALEVAHKLIENFPDTPEAKQALESMDTLVDNARIQEVREYRNRIVDMMDRHRYLEAIEIAKYVVENYPETAAAEELRQQMPQLQELAYKSQHGKL